MRRLAPLAVCLLLGSCRAPRSQEPSATVWGADGGKRAVPMERAVAPKGEPVEVLELLARELETNLARLKADDVTPPAYFLAYGLSDRRQLMIQAEDGRLLRENLDHERVIDVDVRVGSPALDNGHVHGGDYGGNGLGSAMPIAIDDVQLSIAQSLWLDTESQYRDAVAAFSAIESDEQLRSEAGGKDHPDFSVEQALVHIEPRVEADLDAIAETVKPLVRDASQILGADERVLDSSVTIVADETNKSFVNSEGTRVQTGSVLLRLGLAVTAKAEDGMEVQRSEQFEAHGLAQLPNRERLLAVAERLRGEVVALQAAKVAEPYTGPAVLEGPAAGVFFHEIFGHRLEGHRQKDDSEGQTFTNMIDKRVLPTFLDVVDDPTVSLLGGAPLSGHYFVDDEGVKSRRVVLVERGRLKTFLLGRSPVLPFKRSNGHGRREPGYPVLARQGNLIVSSRKTLSEKDLRRALIDEVKRQDKPYGLWFQAIDGGYTTTDRSGPQAFKVLPRLVRRVYADGRPDELVRGVDIVGTPLQAFETIVATGDKPGIFNGVCGAESGWVPVSAVSPSLLLRTLEIERTVHDRDRPPLLRPPLATTTREGS